MRNRLIHIVKKTRIMILFLLLLITVNSSFAQVNNLVPNSDFEFYTSCPDGMAQIIKAYPWKSTVFTGDGSGSSEYLNTCSNDWHITLLMNNYIPFSGSGYAGISLYGWHEDYREYISNKLIEELKINKKYCSSFFIRNHNGNVIVDAIGMLVTDTFVGQYGFVYYPLIYNSQLKNRKGNLLSDTTNLLKISGNFIANGGEQYITIGNFSHPDSITVLYLGTNISGCYYLIDDVSVCDCEDFKPKLGRDTTLCLGQQLLLKANVPKEADSVIYTWQDGSKDSTYLVTQPGIYWVSAYIEDYKITVTDSIRVNYEDCNTPQLWIPNSFTPNEDGLNDKFEYGNADNYEITTYIYNRWGQLIFEGENTDFWDGKYKNKSVALGVYTYRIEATDKANKEKKIHCGRITVL